MLHHSAYSLLPLLITMGFLDFLKKTPEAPQPEPKTTLLGMVLLQSTAPPDFASMTEDLRSRWQISLQETESGEEGAIFSVNGFKVVVAHIALPIPGDEVAQTAALNYYWENGAEEAAGHKSHVLISVSEAGKDPVAANLVFTKVADAVLRSSESIGIYIGNRTLVLQKEFYLSNNEIISEGSLPLHNWIYFGYRQENDRQSVFTYGLKDFGKHEMEILQSTHPFEELHMLMYNMTHYVLSGNVTLKHGETIGSSAEQKLKITLSKGKYLEGQTLKIGY